MSSRDDILASIGANLPRLDRPLPHVPLFDSEPPASLLSAFKDNLLHHAYRRPEFRDRHYASFHTGPSATAEIEGVLIHGAQGVRSLSVLPIARGAGNPTR